MPPDRKDEAWLWDMLVAARLVIEITAKYTYENFTNDPLVRGAIERYIEILGEAASRVSETFRNAHPEIPWTKVIVTRHRFAHEYFRLDPVIVWRIATVHVPELRASLDRLGLDPSQ